MITDVCFVCAKKSDLPAAELGTTLPQRTSATGLEVVWNPVNTELFPVAPFISSSSIPAPTSPLAAVRTRVATPDSAAVASDTSLSPSSGSDLETASPAVSESTCSPIKSPSDSIANDPLMLMRRYQGNGRDWNLRVPIADGLRDRRAANRQIRIIGDGHCFYRAVLSQLRYNAETTEKQATTDEVQELRNQVSALLLQESVWYEVIVGKEMFFPAMPDLKQYMPCFQEGSDCRRAPGGHMVAVYEIGIDNHEVIQSNILADSVLQLHMSQYIANKNFKDEPAKCIPWATQIDMHLVARFLNICVVNFSFPSGLADAVPLQVFNDVPGLPIVFVCFVNDNHYNLVVPIQPPATPAANAGAATDKTPPATAPKPPPTQKPPPMLKRLKTRELRMPPPSLKPPPSLISRRHRSSRRRRKNRRRCSSG